MSFLMDNMSFFARELQRGEALIVHRERGRYVFGFDPAELFALDIDRPIFGRCRGCGRRWPLEPRQVELLQAFGADLAGLRSGCCYARLEPDDIRDPWPR